MPHNGMCPPSAGIGISLTVIQREDEITTFEWQNNESAPMSRKRPSQSGYELCAMKKSRSNGPSCPVQSWQDRAAGSPFSPKPKQSTNDRDSSGPTLVKVYSPTEYLREYSLLSGSESEMRLNDCSHPAYPPSLSDSASILSLPLTSPTSEELPYALPISAEMSRQNSQLSSSLCDGVNLLGLGPKTSGGSDDYWGNLKQPLPLSTPLKRASSATAETQIGTTRARWTTCSQITEMGRSSSSESANPLQPRAVRRHQEQVSQATRPIAPKLVGKQEEQHANIPTSMAHTIMYRSADGSMREARAIPKSSRERPTREGLKCTQCDEKPLGFHGQHELQRHIDNVHAVHRKAWVCIDISPNKDFLSGCRKCMSKKRYGASYNAAEHLRRAHFHKKPRARQSTGKGSDQAAKDDSKSRTSSSELRRWMQEVTDYVPDNLPQPKTETRQPSMAHLHGNNLDARSRCKDESLKKVPNSSHRASSLSQSSSTEISLAKFEIPVGNSQPFSFASCDEHPIRDDMQHDAFHALSIAPFPYTALADTFPNLELFAFDPDFDTPPEAHINDFPFNISLAC